jgi:hypothetical protein
MTTAQRLDRLERALVEVIAVLPSVSDDLAAIREDVAKRDRGGTITPTKPRRE